MQIVCNTYWDAGKGNMTTQNTRKPAEGAYSAPGNHIWWERLHGAVPSPRTLSPALGSSGLASPTPTPKLVPTPLTIPRNVYPTGSLSRGIKWPASHLSYPALIRQSRILSVRWLTRQCCRKYSASRRSPACRLSERVTIVTWPSSLPSAYRAKHRSPTETASNQSIYAQTVSVLVDNTLWSVFPGVNYAAF